MKDTIFRQTLVRCMLTMAAASAIAACGEEGAPESAPPKGTFGLGASGPAVAEAFGYLKAHGYYPNEALAKEYPSWKPIVTELPARPDVIDQPMQKAISKLQMNLGLPATGILDESTLSLMRQPQCGVPHDDPTQGKRVEKFALYAAGNRWTKTAITYRFTSTGGLAGLDQQRTRAVIGSAIRFWESYTNLTFSEVTSGGDVTISFANIDGPGNILGTGASPPSPSITIDSSETWTGTKLVSLVLHESGHMIGMDHSSMGNSVVGFPVMHPVNHNVVELTDDDIVAANAIYNDWTLLPGRAIDIGANSITGASGEIVFILGTDHVPYQWNGTTWVSKVGVVGTRIDVDHRGVAWVVGDNQHIFRQTGDSLFPWEEVPGGGLAKDIGIGQDGSVWVIGLDGQAWNFNSSQGAWVFKGGPAGQIAIDVSPSGQPFVVTSNQQLWALASGWAQVTSGVGSDVGIGGKLNGPGTATYTYVLGTNSQVFLYDLQPALSVPFSCDGKICSTGAPATNTFIATNGFATRLTAGSRGREWVVTSSNQIFVRKEMPF